MERYSEDLDFSVVSTVPANEIVALVRDILKGEEVIDCKVKRKTVLAEMRQQFRPQNFRVKLEINTDNIVPAELKTLYSEYVPASFDLQIMRTDYLIAQKVRALLQRKKGRDLHDLWFVLRTKLPVDISIVSEMAGIPKSEVLLKLEEKIAALDERQIAADIRPFVRPSLRPWVKDGLKRDVLQLLRSVSAANY